MYIHTYRHAHTHTLTHTLSQQSTTHRTHHHTNAISISWQQRTTALHTDPITTHTLIRYIYTHTLPTTTRRQRADAPPRAAPPPTRPRTRHAACREHAGPCSLAYTIAY